MNTKPKTRKAKGQNTVLNDIEDRGRRLDDLAMEDVLNEMKNRCFVLQIAIEGACTFEDNNIKEGVLWLADDITAAIVHIAEAFKDERQLRIAEEHQSETA